MNPFEHPLLGNMGALVRLIRSNPEQAKAMASEFAAQGILPPFAGPSELLQHVEPFAKRTVNVNQNNLAMNAAGNPNPQGTTPIMPGPDELSAALLGRNSNG